MEENKITPSGKILVIGGSAGSIEVILKMLPELKEGLRFPIVIVLHRKQTNDSSLADLFASRTKIIVKEIEDKEILSPGTIYVAPGDYHLLFEKNNFFSLDSSEKINYSRPSIDVSFESASDIYKSKLTCLILSGANADGSEGLKLVKANGGRIAVQDPKTANSPFMPQQALAKCSVDSVLKPKEIAGFINSL